MYNNNRGKYIDEITALRGLSVLLVLGCHWGIPFAQSGFIGVDIFFVISGYLITSILLREYNKSQAENNGIGQISIKVFYLRRIRRIVPASLTTLLIVYTYYQVFGNSIRKSQVSSDFLWSIAAFANNHFHYMSTDYFAANSAQSPLLHYWSLSVEEQFYFVWPFLVLSVVNFHYLKISKRYIRWPDRILLLALVITISSFILFFITYLRNPVAAYFLTGTRAWELGVGAVFAVLAERRIHIFSRIDLKHMHSISTVVLFLSLLFVTDRNFGFTLIVPVFAAGLFLYSISLELNPSREWKGMICNRFLTFVGKISFSLYLWHFPLYIAFKEKWQNPSEFQFLVLLCVTFIVSIMSFKYIETPFISGKFSPNKKGKNEIAAHNLIRESKFKYPSVVVAIIFFISVTPNLVQDFSSSSNDSVTWMAPDLEELFPGITLENPSTSANQIDALQSNDQFDNMTLEKWNEVIRLSTKDGSVPQATYNQLSKIKQARNKYEIMCFDVIPQPCTLHNPPDAGKTVLLLGDSRMLMVLPPIVETFKRKGGWKVVNWSLYDCTIIQDQLTDLPNSDCVDRRSYVNANLKALNPDLIIISERMYQNPTSSYRKQIEYFTEKGISKKVLQILPFGFLINAPESCLDNDGSYRIECFAQTRDTNRELFAMSSRLNAANIPYFSMQNILCSPSMLCPPVVQNVYVYRDYSHITPTFAAKLSDIYSYSINRNSPVDLN